MDKKRVYEYIPKGDSPVNIVLYNDFGSHKFSAHCHEHLELHYILEGSSKVWCEGQMIEVKKGECIVINCNELHEGVDGNSKYICILLPPSFLDKKGNTYRRVIKDEAIREIFLKIYDEYIQYEKPDNMAITGYAYLLMSAITRSYVFKAGDRSTLGAYSEKSIILNSAIKYINENYRDEIDLDSIEKLTNLNKYYFCHAFKDYTGKTFKEYINSIRIAKAEELLIGTDIPVTEIAFMCGFNDSNYFSRKFKQVKGVPPREVRKNTI